MFEQYRLVSSLFSFVTEIPPSLKCPSFGKWYNFTYLLYRAALRFSMGDLLTCRVSCGRLSAEQYTMQQLLRHQCLHCWQQATVLGEMASRVECPAQFIPILIIQTDMIKCGQTATISTFLKLIRYTQNIALKYTILISHGIRATGLDARALRLE